MVAKAELVEALGDAIAKLTGVVFYAPAKITFGWPCSLQHLLAHLFFVLCVMQGAGVINDLIQWYLMWCWMMATVGESCTKMYADLGPLCQAETWSRAVQQFSHGVHVVSVVIGQIWLISSLDQCPVQICQSLVYHVCLPMLCTEYL